MSYLSGNSYAVSEIDNIYDDINKDKDNKDVKKEEVKTENTPTTSESEIIENPKKKLKTEEMKYKDYLSSEFNKNDKKQKIDKINKNTPFKIVVAKNYEQSITE